MQMLRRLVDMIEVCAANASPDEVLAGIEQDLRARYATEIPVNDSKAVAIELAGETKAESVQVDNENG